MPLVGAQARAAPCGLPCAAGTYHVDFPDVPLGPGELWRLCDVPVAHGLARAHHTVALAKFRVARQRELHALRLCRRGRGRRGVGGHRRCGAAARGLQRARAAGRGMPRHRQPPLLQRVLGRQHRAGAAQAAERREGTHRGASHAGPRAERHRAHPRGERARPRHADCCVPRRVQKSAGLQQVWGCPPKL